MLFDEMSEKNTSEKVKALKAYTRFGNQTYDETKIDHSQFNKLIGKVSADRQQHETTSNHNGIAHWRRNTTKQQHYDDQVMHAGMFAPGSRNVSRQGEEMYKTGSHVMPVNTPGMGLDAENLVSFMTTGTHSIVAVPEETAPVREAQTQTDISSGYKVKKMKTATFTNMLARPAAVNS